MRLRQSIRFAVAAAPLLGLFPAQAQLAQYNQQDLLLNFRNATTPTDPDVVVDLGNAGTFVSSIAALPGGTAVLDTVSGVAPTSGYTALFSAGADGGDGLLGLFGTPSTVNAIGFSAAASDQTSKIIWLTRQISGPSATPTTQPAPANGINQGKTANDIAGIGNGGVAGTAFSGSATGAAAVVASGGVHSYQTEAEASVSLPNVISYQGSQSPTGGAIEASQTGSGSIYEALWEVPASGSGSPIFEGFFTFAPSGEVDFTAAGFPVSQPQPPNLIIVANGLDSVQVLWPATGAYTLEQNANLVMTNAWSASGYPVSTSNGTNSVTISPPTGDLFFRLANQ